MKKLLIILVIILLLAPISLTKAIVPVTDNFYINDTAGVLSDFTKKEIIEKNIHLYNKTGAQIVVVTVDFIDTTSIADYAYEVFNEYGIGSKEKNNGLLLLLSIGDDDYYALQGSGLERLLTSGTLSYLLYEYLEPYFAIGEYDQGVMAVFDEFYYELLYIYDTEALPPAEAYPDYPLTYPDDFPQYYPDTTEYIFSFFSFIFLFFRSTFAIMIILWVLISVFGNKNKHRGGRGSSSSSSSVWPLIIGGHLINKSNNRSSGGSSISRGSSTFGGSSSSSRAFSSGGFSSRGSGGSTHSGGGGGSRGGGAGRAGR